MCSGRRSLTGLVRPRKTVAAVLVTLAGLSAAGTAAPAWAAPAPPATPVATPTPEPALPGQGPGGVPVGGTRMGSVNVQLAGRGAAAAGRHQRPRPGWSRTSTPATCSPPATRTAATRRPARQKWLTALTLLPKFGQAQEIVATDADVDVDGTRVGLVEHGRYTVDLLFQSMLMASGNDAANALARVAGSVPSTVAAMNAEAGTCRRTTRTLRRRPGWTGRIS